MQPDIYTLYLTAIAPARTGFDEPNSTSPRVILERFVGSKHAIDAPDWTQWAARTTQTFQQPRATFLVLFTRIAMWPVNKLDVCMSRL